VRQGEAGGVQDAGVHRRDHHSASGGASAASIEEERKSVLVFDWKEGGLELRYEEK